MAKKKLKFVSKEKFEVYQHMTVDELVATIKTQHAFLESQETIKKGSSLLKEIKSEISEYKKNWGLENPEKLEEIEALKESIKKIQNERDAKIDADLEEKKSMEAGFNDQINGAKEHLLCLAFCLRFHQ